MSDPIYEDTYFLRPTQQQIINDPYSMISKVARRYRWILQQGKPIEASSRCLDIGAGLGQGSWILSQQANYVIGVDISKFAMKFADQAYKNFKLEFMHADFLKTPLQGTFDYIFCVHLLEHIAPQNMELFVARLHQFCHLKTYCYIDLPLEASWIGRADRWRRKLKQKPPHDPTHISFHNVRSIVSLFKKNNFQLVKCIRNFPPLPKFCRFLQKRFVWGRVKNLFTVEGLFIFQPNSHKEVDYRSKRF